MGGFGVSDLVFAGDERREGEGSLRYGEFFLLTLEIYGTADDFLAGGRRAAICGPAYTVDVVGITGGNWGGFIVAGLLFRYH